jgi:serine/threonine-protein kinase HipA
MTSNAPRRLFVWAWLPDAATPVVAGVLERHGSNINFAYGRSYLDRVGAVPLYMPELPLQRGSQRPPAGMTIAGCISDATPDAWGRRVILHRRYGHTDDIDPGELDELTYLAESGSDRIGALDFQASADEYVPRTQTATLNELLQAADRLQHGEPFSPALDQALLHGSSVGGARPKALLDDGDKKYIAKFSSTTDPYPVVKAEAVAMELARRVGLTVAATSIVNVLDRDVLLVERFDRAPGNRRKMMVSALTILGLDEMAGRWATYHDLADTIRTRFIDPVNTLRELFARITFNIICGNTDDHARNHAAFWDGANLELTPAYDICPQLRSGGIAAQAMAIGVDGFRWSNLAGCLNAANTYLLDAPQARSIIEHQLEIVQAEWEDAADRCRLTTAEKAQIWRRQMLNPYALENW